MTIRMKKIKVTSDNKIMMMYEKQVRENWDEYSFTSSEKAKPSFYEAITKLAPHVIELCELPDGYLERVTVRGVSFSYGGLTRSWGRLYRLRCALTIPIATLT